MDGTWKPKAKEIKYLICPSCKELMKKGDVLKIGKIGYCRNCAQI